MDLESHIPLAVPVSARDHVRGPANAPVTLVEYGDYQCPACGRAFAELQRVLPQLAGAVRFVFRHFPLLTVHLYAEQAAEAAEAAAAQGRFWPMHEQLFAHQAALALPDLLGYAHGLGLDVSRIDAEVRRHAYGERIREDLNGGLRSGVRATPTFYINGVEYVGDSAGLLPALRAAAGG